MLALPTLAVLNHLIFWIDGTVAVGTFNLFRLVDAVYVIYFLALYHYLSRVASYSFKIYQPLLGVTDEESEILAFKLTNLPRRLGWVGIALGAPLTILSIQTEPGDFGLAQFNSQLPVVYQYLLAFFVFSSLLAVVIQTIRQLRLVSNLHRQATEIDLFQLAPAHAFAHLTARAGIGLIFMIVFNWLIVTSAVSALDIAFYSLIGLFAIAVFVLPLSGMRNRLKDEKVRLIGETDGALKSIMRRIHARVDAGEHEEAGKLNGAINALIAERDFLGGISIWPWEPSTLRGFASTLLLPIFLWLITRLLERLI